MKFKIKYSLFVLLFGSSFALNNDLLVVGRASIVAFIIINLSGIAGRGTYYKIKKNYAFDTITILLLTCCLVTCISGIINEEITLPLNFLLLVLLYLVLCKFLSYFPSLNSLLKFIYVNLLIISVTVIVLSLLIEPFSLYRYQGIFNNPNNMGWLVTGILPYILFYTMINYKHLPKLQLCFSFLLVFLLLLFLLASNSRGALLSLVFSLLVVVGIKSTPIGLRVRKENVKLAMSLTLGMTAILVFALASGLGGHVVEKFMKLNGLSLMEASERLEVWRIIIREINLFGYGSDYRADLQLDYGAHNNYLNILAKFGAVASVLYTMKIIILIWRAFGKRESELTHDQNVLKICALATGSNFFINSMFEVGSAVPGILLLYLLGSALRHDGYRGG